MLLSAATLESRSGEPPGAVVIGKDITTQVILNPKALATSGGILGVLGIIPGSMASPGFLVRGKGNPDSLRSASHGAGRVMSRTQATRTFDWKKVKAFLREKSRFWAIFDVFWPFFEIFEHFLMLFGFQQQSPQQ